MRLSAVIASAALGAALGVCAGSGAFGDALSVRDAVQIALRQSPALAAARADVRAAGADARVARSMTGVRMSANWFLTAGDMESMVGSTPDVAPPFSRDVPAKGFAVQNVTVMAPIYTGGRLRGQVRAADQRAGMVAAEEGAVRQDVALVVKEAYYRALMADELAAAAKARLDAGSELVRVAKAQLDAGKGIEASVWRAEAEVADARREWTSAQNDYAKAVLDMQTAMGVVPGKPITLADALVYTAPSGDVERSLAEAKRLRPELAAARARAAEAQAQAGSARGALQPQVYGALMADAFVGRDRSAATGYTVGIAVGLPLLDGGQRRAEIARADAVRERAAEEERATVLRVEREVRQAWLDLDTAERNYRTAQSALESARAAYDVIALRVQNQKGIQLELLDALATLDRARGDLARALYDHAMAQARLDRAIGRE